MLDTNKNHLGQGLAFPLNVTMQGNMQISPKNQNIEESIGIILRTHLGERVYRPDFGSRLGELAFAPMNTQTLLLARLYTQEALEKWEPRIVVDAVRAEPDPVRGRLDVIIEYHPRNSHEQRSLVFPFYLMPGS
ncbi:GPW/gp25 family protein [Calothrix sp. PCC 6303]|uniref:GPW/gp25 family protein n=1 Tax=Calothrix sp. PCC 6303 TaxID=1170562 RepID=UPI0002A02169|nr:GPW/gp25 family protein [Calothrix sp. PCC 6303]AFZ01390.1 GPW/gp25 family protein [Calothrix sp. PCC 6303]